MPESGARSEAACLQAPTLDHVPELVALEDRCFTSYYEPHRYNAEALKRHLGNPRRIAWIAVDDEDLVGYILGEQLTGVLRQITRLDSIAVDVGRRNSGWGGRLLQRFLEGATARGCQKVLAETAVRNKGARHFFARHGFTEGRTLKGYYGKKTDGIQLEYRLPKKGESK